MAVHASAAAVVAAPALSRHRTDTAPSSVALANFLLRCTINILLKFIILYFNNFILLRSEKLYVILARHNELLEDDILNVETCRSMLFVIIVFDIRICAIVQSFVKL